MPTFQYTTIKTKNFCTFKNLINNIKSSEDTKIGVFKVVKTFWRKEIYLKVDPENKIVLVVAVVINLEDVEQLKKQVTYKYIEKNTL